MRNKKIIQQADRIRHKKLLRNTSVKRCKKFAYEREVSIQEIKPSILIVCEGENTETSYFRQFRLSSATIITVGKGDNTVSLVKRALKIQRDSDFYYNSVWCVFDKDDFPASDFNQAIMVAEANDLGVAYSNQAFEYWLILHFEDHQGGALHRRDYTEKINSYIQPLGAYFDGDGDKYITRKFYHQLMDIDSKTGKSRMMLAIERAKRIYARDDHTSPASEESSTTVFRLIEELLKHT